MRRRKHLHRLGISAGGTFVAVLLTAGIGTDAHAQAANETGANVNLLNLLSPFLKLNSNTTGQTTLQNNLSVALSTNNNASLALEQLSISDKNLLNAASNTVTGLSGTFGVAANLGGGLPAQAAINAITPQQAVGGLGTQLGAIYNTGVANGTSGPLAKTVNLLTMAYNFTSSDLGAAKNYFANGTTNGTTTAVAPSGFTLPTFNGLPNLTNSIYDIAYGVTNTQPGQDIFGSSRPDQVALPQINQFDPTALAGLTTNPSFPSGHTTYAYTDSLLLAMMVPQEYQNMLSRAAEYANSRIVLGVHYPLDIIGSRSLASYDLAQFLTNPAYINNATLTGTAVNLPSLFTQAMPELNSYLSAQCGATVATCATSTANTTNNPYVPSAANQATYTSRLTYNLPTLSFTQAPREAAPTGGPDASILLATIYGGDSSAAKTIAPNGGLIANLQTATINQIIMNTETNALSAFFGTSLSYWSRLDLYSAFGYFQNVTGTISLATGDTVSTNTTVASNGVLAGTGVINGLLTNSGQVSPGHSVGTMTVNGNYVQTATGTLVAQADNTGFSRLVVNGQATIGGTLQIVPINGYTPNLGQLSSVLTASQGISGTFGTLSVPTLPGSFFLQPIYSAQSVNLVTALPLGTIGSTPNQRAVGQALDQNRNNPDSSIQNAVTALYPAEAGGGAGRGLDQLSPQNVFTETAFSQRFADVLANQMAGRASALRAGASGFAVDSGRFDVASNTVGGVGDMVQNLGAGQAAGSDSGFHIPGFDHNLGGFFSGQVVFGDRTYTPNQSGKDFTAGGVTFGLDYRVSPDSVVGIAGSYFTGDADNAGGSTNANAGAGSLYGTTQAGPIYVDGFFGGGFTDYTTKRSVSLGALAGTATGSPSGHFIAMGGDIGYRFQQPTQNGLLRWGPVGEFRFNNAAVDAYSESGLGGVSTHIFGRDTSSVQSGFGAEAALDVATSMGIVTPHIRATWQHEYADTTETAVAHFLVTPASPFGVVSTALGRDFAGVTAGVSGMVAPGIKLSADYSGELGRSNQTVHQVSLQARIAF